MVKRMFLTIFCISLFVSGVIVRAQQKTIVFVRRAENVDPATGECRDQPYIDKLIAVGYNVIEFYNAKLGEASDATIDTLNSADLVIIGRSGSSGHFGGVNKEAWNGLTAPVMLMHQWAGRNQAKGRLNWFDTNKCEHFQDSSAVNDTLDALIEDPDDPAFAGVTIGADNLVPWHIGQYDLLMTSDPGNGTLLASSADTNGTVLFVRFKEGVEFYPGAIDFPSAPRTYMGIGNDDLDDPTSGEKIVNYYQFTPESEQVWLNEIALMTELVYTPVPQKTIVLVRRAENINAATGECRDQPFINKLREEGYNVIEFYCAKLGEASQISLDTLNNVDLVIIGRSGSSSHFGKTNKQAWNGIHTPVMLMHQWAGRNEANGRLNWFDTNKCEHFQDSSVVNDTLSALIGDPDDPAFAGVTIGADNLVPWHSGQYDLLMTTDPGNGTLLASSADTNAAVLFVRFTEGLEFYPGAIDFPSAPCTYMGIGNDEVVDPKTGDKIVNYYQFTPESEKVWLNEIKRMTRLVEGVDWVYVSQPTDVDANDCLVAMEYALFQNYPNPFNPSTKIRFNLKKSTHTTLTIYNVMGQKVITVVDRKLNSGTHEFTFDASQLTSGVYFYKISSGEFTKVKKMMLVK